MGMYNTHFFIDTKRGTDQTIRQHMASPVNDAIAKLQIAADRAADTKKLPMSSVLAPNTQFGSTIDRLYQRAQENVDLNAATMIVFGKEYALKDVVAFLNNPTTETYKTFRKMGKEDPSVEVRWLDEFLTQARLASIFVVGDDGTLIVDENAKTQVIAEIVRDMLRHFSYSDYNNEAGIVYLTECVENGLEIKIFKYWKEQSKLSDLTSVILNPSAYKGDSKKVKVGERNEAAIALFQEVTAAYVEIVNSIEDLNRTLQQEGNTNVANWIRLGIYFSKAIRFQYGILIADMIKRSIKITDKNVAKGFEFTDDIFIMFHNDYNTIVDIMYSKNGFGGGKVPPFTLNAVNEWKRHVDILKAEQDKTEDVIFEKIQQARAAPQPQEPNPEVPSPNVDPEKQQTPLPEEPQNPPERTPEGTPEGIHKESQTDAEIFKNPSSLSGTITSFVDIAAHIRNLQGTPIIEPEPLPSLQNPGIVLPSQVTVAPLSQTPLQSTLSSMLSQHTQIPMGLIPSFFRPNSFITTGAGGVPVQNQVQWFQAQRPQMQYLLYVLGSLNIPTPYNPAQVTTVNVQAAFGAARSIIGEIPTVEDATRGEQFYANKSLSVSNYLSTLQKGFELFKKVGDSGFTILLMNRLHPQGSGGQLSSAEQLLLVEGSALETIMQAYKPPVAIVVGRFPANLGRASTTATVSRFEKNPFRLSGKNSVGVPMKAVQDYASAIFGTGQSQAPRSISKR